MSPRCRRCPPVLLALLLGLARSGGSQECRDQDVTAGGSLCLVPEEPPQEWMEIRWRVKMDSGEQYTILIANRDGDVLHSKGPFHGRVKFHPGNLSLCISPINKAESGVYRAEFENSSGIFHQCFQVSMWDPIPEPSLKSQIQQRDRGWCLLSLLCSSPANGNVSISWECPEHPKPTEFPEFLKSTEPPKFSEPTKSQSQRFQWIPEDAEPQICLCNLSNPGGWRAAQASLTCTGVGESFFPGILGNLGLWAALGVGLILILVLIVMLGVWRRKRRKENSREDPPGAPAGSLEPLSVYAEVGARNASMPRKDDGTTIYTTVTPRTLEHPRNREQPSSVTVYATVQRPSSMKRKRLERALVSTAYLEDNGDYGKFGFPNPKS